jgi:hypothetical protein
VKACAYGDERATWTSGRQSWLKSLGTGEICWSGKVNIEEEMDGEIESAGRVGLRIAGASGEHLTAALLAFLDMRVSRWSDASVCRSRNSVVRFISRISSRLLRASETCTTCGSASA